MTRTTVPRALALSLACVLVYAAAAQEVDEIEVLWPSGLTTTVTDIPADQLITLTEPRS